MIVKPILLDMPMPIMTSRLKIVPMHIDYAEQVHQAVLESAETLIPWMGWMDTPMTLDERKEMAVRKYVSFLLREDDIMMIALTHEGRFVAATGWHDINWRMRTAQIGYWARSSEIGKGYVTEAANALTRYAFEVMGLRKIDIGMDSENTASENVAKRLGMTKEAETLGTIRTLHEGDALRRRLHYVAFDTSGLPPLEVSW